MTGRSRWWIPPIVCDAGGRWEEGRAFLFFPLLSSLLRWSLFKMSGSGSSHRWSSLCRLYAVTKCIYMSTVLKDSFWKICTLLEIFWETFFLRLSLHYVSKTKAVLLAPLRVFFFVFVWWLSSLLSRALKWAGAFLFPKKGRRPHALFLTGEKPVAATALCWPVWRRRENVSNLPKSLSHIKRLNRSYE